MISIYHNLGLGDHIIFCGLVHTILEEKRQPIKLYCKKHNVPTVKALYAHYDVIIDPIEDDAEVNRKRDSFCLDFHRTITKTNRHQTFDQEIYEDNNFPYINRWLKFNFELPQTIIPVAVSNYVFIHDDKERGFIISSNKYVINSRVEYRPNKNHNKTLLDYSLLILNADEVHVIDSSFRILTDQLYSSEKFVKLRKNNKTPRLFYHKYARRVEQNGWHVPSVKCSYWKDID